MCALPCPSVRSLGTLAPMAELTLKDLLDAIATFRAESKADLDATKRELKADLAKVDGKVETLDTKMGARFDRVDKQLAVLDQ